MSNLAFWQIREMRELIGLLVALEQPATEHEAKRLRREWRDAGYEAVVEAWTHWHRKQRRQEV